MLALICNLTFAARKCSIVRYVLSRLDENFSNLMMSGWSSVLRTSDSYFNEALFSLKSGVSVLSSFMARCRPDACSITSQTWLLPPVAMHMTSLYVPSISSSSDTVTSSMSHATQPPPNDLLIHLPDIRWRRSPRLRVGLV